MKILITNTVILNGGDAAILLAILDLLQAAFGENVEFVIYGDRTNIASRYYPELTLREQYKLKNKRIIGLKYLETLLKYLNKTRLYLAARLSSLSLAKLLLTEAELQDITEYSSADLIVSTGGTYLVENYSLEDRIFSFRIAQLTGRPLVFFTQSLGPFLNPSYQKNFREIFNSALLVLLRDEASLKHLQDINVAGENVRVSSDAVFAWAEETVLEKARHESFPKGAALRIAISVRNWPYFKSVTPAIGMERFKDTLGAVTKYLVEKHNAEITYVSTCQGIPEYSFDDAKVASEIVNSLPDSIQKNIIVNDKFNHAKQLLKSLKEYDIVIATRMHMAILSLAAGTPVFPIAYEFKTQELFERLGLGEWVQDIENVNAESLISSVESFIKNLPKIRLELFTKVAKERERAWESSILTQKAFEEWQNSRK